MEKYLIAFDLDGTMLPKVSTLPDPVRDIIRRLKADGHIPVIASARPRDVHVVRTFAPEEAPFVRNEQRCFLVSGKTSGRVP